MFLKKQPQVRRRKQQAPNTAGIPSFKTPPINRGAGFIWGILFWILIAIVSLIAFYVQMVSFNTSYILKTLKVGMVKIPFWFSLLLAIFVFPVTIVIILLGSFLRMTQRR